MQAGPSNRKQCPGIRADGAPCRSTPQRGSDFCFTHDPARAAERDEARRRGGQNRSNVARLQAHMPPRLNALYGRLEQALDDVLAGRINPRIATAAAALASAMVRVFTDWELEERLRRLEEQQAGEDAA
jgi:hypothetical protein